MIRDVIDIIKQVKDFESDGGDSLMKKILAPSSARPTIFKNASGMVAYFPILAGKSISYELLERVRSGFESEYANYLGLALNAKASLAGETTTASAVLKKVHSNELPQKGVNVGSVRDMTRALLDESVKLNAVTMAEDFNMSLLEDDNTIHVAKGGIGVNHNHNTIGGKSDRELAEIERSNKAKEDISREDNKTKAELEKSRIDILAKSKAPKHDFVTEVKKRVDNNSTAPTLVDVNIPIAEGNISKITYGVKCQTHLLGDEEIMEYTANTIKKKSMMFRMIQWYSGELKMWKDIILNNPDNKKMAMSSAWWKFLYNNAKINKFKAFIRNDYLMIPNATLLLTETQVELISRKYNVDVRKDANTLVNELFLARIAILDESTEVISIFDERTKSFQKITVRSLQSKDEKATIEDLFKNMR